MAWFGLLCCHRSCPRPRAARPQSRQPGNKDSGLVRDIVDSPVESPAASFPRSLFPLVSKPLASDPFCSPCHDPPAFPWSRSWPDFAALSSSGCVVLSDIKSLVHCNGLSPSEGR
jgi:hypothetical protein